MRWQDERLDDILVAAEQIAAHLRRGSVDDGLVFDAVRMRLLEIGEAVKSLDPALMAQEPDVPWVDIAQMRDRLAHRYFDTGHAIISSTVRHDLEPLVAAVRRLRRVLEPPSGPEVQV